MESGLYHFYLAYGEFVGKVLGAVKAASNQPNDSFYKVSMQDFFFPLISFFILMLLSVLVFCVEIIYFNRKNILRVFQKRSLSESS